MFEVKEKDTARVRSYISLATDINNINFLWGIKDKETDSYPLYALKKTPSGKPILSGDVITAASQQYDYVGNPAIVLKMNEVGARIWERMTEKAYVQRSFIAMVLNDEVYSAPGVSSGPIMGGMTELSGNFTIEEAQDLANILSTSGEIPKMKILTFDVQKIE